MKLSSDFAILDVKDGRHALHEHFITNPDVRIAVTIKGYIDAFISADDGVSREFSVVVEELIHDPA